MEYKELYIPFECNFRNMKKKQAQEFLDWYMSMIPERIEILKAKVGGRF